MNRLAKLFAFQCASYFLIVANTRAISQASYIATAATDLLIAAQSFLAVRLIAKGDDGDRWGIVAYAVGGVCGSLLSLWVGRLVGL